MDNIFTVFYFFQLTEINVIDENRDLDIFAYLFSDESIKSEEYGIIGISSFSSSAASVAASRSVSVFLAQALKYFE